MIYLDNAATTPMRKCCLDAIETYGINLFYNPSALYEGGVTVSTAISQARYKLASLLNVQPQTLVFTSSGTESNNHILQCARKKKGGRIILSETEHSSVFSVSNDLKMKGYEVVFAPVDAYGRVILSEFKKLLTNDTCLVSIMHVNNVTGAINPIEDLVKTTKAFKKDILFHSDGVQAFCKVPVNLESLGVDFYSISGHKVGAPKGIGLLYVKRGVHLSPYLFGGGQEKGMRSSTENVAGIVAFSLAAQEAYSQMSILREKSKLFFGKLRDILSNMPNIQWLTGEKSAPHILTFAMEGVRGEVLMHSLEKYGIMVGIGSACSSNGGVGRVAKALKLDNTHYEGVIRISISSSTDEKDAEFVGNSIIEEYNDLVKYKRI